MLQELELRPGQVVSFIIGGKKRLGRVVSISHNPHLVFFATKRDGEWIHYRPDQLPDIKFETADLWDLVDAFNENYELADIISA